MKTQKMDYETKKFYRAYKRDELKEYIMGENGYLYYDEYQQPVVPGKDNLYYHAVKNAIIPCNDYVGKGNLVSKKLLSTMTDMILSGDIYQIRACSNLTDAIFVMDPHNRLGFEKLSFDCFLNNLEKQINNNKYPTETELIDYIKKEYNKLSKDTFTVIFKEYKSKSPVYTLKMIMNGAEMELGEIILGSPIDSSSHDYGRIISVNSTSTLPIGDINSYAAYNYQIATIPVYAMAKLMGDTYLDFDGFYKQFSCCAETTGSYVYEISNYDIMGVLSKTNLSSSVVYGKTECELLESVVSAYQVN